MNRETLLLAAAQSSVLFLSIWAIFRLVPSTPANAKAWIWRLAFLKPLAIVLPFAVVALPVLPASNAVDSPEVAAKAAAPVREFAALAIPSVDPLIALWILGAIVMAGYGIAGSVRATRIARRAYPVSDSEVLDSLKQLSSTAQLRHTPRLMKSDDVDTAMLIGGWRSTIILPTRPASIEDTRLMLAHEIAHIARRDLGWFGLIWISQSLFFFNPVVWLAAHCSRLDHESATDRHASQLAKVPVTTYADMLLRATVVARPSPLPGALPMAESFRTIHRRLEAMKHFDSKPSAWRKSAIAVLALVTVGLMPIYQLAEAAPVGRQDPKATTTVPPVESQTRKPLGESRRQKNETTVLGDGKRMIVLQEGNPEVRYYVKTSRKGTKLWKRVLPQKATSKKATKAAKLKQADDGKLHFLWRLPKRAPKGTGYRYELMTAREYAELRKGTKERLVAPAPSESTKPKKNKDLTPSKAKDGTSQGGTSERINYRVETVYSLEDLQRAAKGNR